MRRLERLISLNPNSALFCIRFRPKTDDDIYFISIRNGSGCSSYVCNQLSLKIIDNIIFNIGWTCSSRGSKNNITNEIILC